MSSFAKSIPMTPDMVSLWVPSGLNRAQDLIRGNHGQCYGTHPNVPVISPSIVQVNACDATTYWTGTALTIDEADKKEGTGSLVDTVVTPVIATTYTTRYNFAGTCDWSGKKHILFWLKSDRASGAFAHAQLRINEGVNWRAWDLTFAANTWTAFKLLLSTGDDQSATPPDITSIDWIQLQFRTADETTFHKKIDNLRVTGHPSLINTAVGWKFDGTNDYINLGNDGSLNVTDATLGAWVYFKSNDECAVLSKIGSDNHGYIFGVNASGVLTAVVANGTDWEGSSASDELVTHCWHYIVATFKQSGTDTIVKLYEKCCLVGTATEDGQVSHGSYDNQLGRWNASFLMDGYIALPFITNSAWSAAQVSNFYNATKGMFAPRG